MGDNHEETMLLRPSFNHIYMSLALMLSERSTCRRLKVGCVISSDDYRQIYAVGYNGSAAGLGNDCDRHGPEAVGSCGCVHGEMNAVINCTADRRASKIVFCTHLPCATCGKFLINLGGVQKVYYLYDYRIRDSLEMFQKVGIAYEQAPVI